MSTRLIDGKALAAAWRERTKETVTGLDFTPGLGVVLVGDNPASRLYVGLKEKACREAGIRFTLRELPAETEEAAVSAAVTSLNEDPEIDAILVQLPLPPHLDADRIVGSIEPDKDADGFHPAKADRYLADSAARRPVLVAAIEELLRATGEVMAGQRAVVVGNSSVFGTPIKKMLERAGAQATWVAADDGRLADRTAAADMLIVAAGRPGLITGQMVKPGAIIIDVGTTRVAGRTVGDVDMDSVAGIAGHLTPVPGGVGPMTVALLLDTAVDLARQRAVRGIRG